MDVTPALGILGKNELVREGLRRILSEEGFHITGTASHVNDLFIDRNPIELLLVDANSEDSGLQGCMAAKANFPDIRIVLMADEFSASEVTIAFQSDVIDGYIVKRIGCKSLAAALRLVAMGEKVFPSQMIESLGVNRLGRNFKSYDTGTPGANLSNRESEILSCLVSGDANKVISRRLNISDATVKVHIKAILRKLRVTNRTQAAIWAVSRGLGINRLPAPSPLRDTVEPAEPQQSSCHTLVPA